MPFCSTTLDWLSETNFMTAYSDTWSWFRFCHKTLPLYAAIRIWGTEGPSACPWSGQNCQGKDPRELQQGFIPSSLHQLEDQGILTCFPVALNLLKVLTEGPLGEWTLDTRMKTALCLQGAQREAGGNSPLDKHVTQSLKCAERTLVRGRQRTGFSQEREGGG